MATNKENLIDELVETAVLYEPQSDEEKYLMDIAKEASRAALGTEYSKLSGTMKIGEIGRGKSRLPQTWFPPGSF